MTDPTRPENDARVPEESPEELGNTIDGSGAGDGSTTRGTDEEGRAPASRPSTAGGTGHAAGDAATGASGESSADRAEQSKVYRPPEQPNHAVGGSDGTADGQ
ncbi:hypothetical protein JTP68_10430 [Dietzia cinnamea]|uniref:hypothetical protein n=1 Tax=Dietzia cinnamea TaxID=321318 RepID=UPI000D622A5F|nr:hypothetical protein [Dietzia cinnamea]PWD97207.1 hypothetical protein DEQ16_01720 [Dietzia maris]